MHWKIYKITGELNMKILQKIKFFKLFMASKPPKDTCSKCGAPCGDTVCPDCKKKYNIRFD